MTQDGSQHSNDGLAENPLLRPPAQCTAPLIEWPTKKAERTTWKACLALAIIGAVAARYAVPFSLEYSIGFVPFLIGVALFCLYRARASEVIQQFSNNGHFALNRELVVTILTALLLSAFLVLGSWATCEEAQALSPLHALATALNAIPLVVLLLWLWQMLDHASSRFSINHADNKCCLSTEPTTNNAGNPFTADDTTPTDAIERPSKQSPLYIRASSFLFGRWWPVLCFGILLFCWLPVFLAAYPGFFCYDMTIGDYAEWTQFTEHELYTHHSVFHTLLMGSLIRSFVDLSGSFNFGVAAYLVFQALLIAGIFAFMLARIRLASGSHLLCGVSLAYLALDPLVSMFVLCTTKDTLFSAFALLLAVLFYGYFANKEHRSAENLVAITIAGAAFCILRPNGVLVFSLAVPIIVAFALRGTRMKLLVSCIAALSLGMVWLGPISTILEVQEAELQRVNALSIPAQQLSYLYQNDLLDDDEKEILESLGFENEGSYYPILPMGRDSTSGT